MSSVESRRDPGVSRVGWTTVIGNKIDFRKVLEVGVGVRCRSDCGKSIAVRRKRETNNKMGIQDLKRLTLSPIVKRGSLEHQS